MMFQGIISRVNACVSKIIAFIYSINIAHKEKNIYEVCILSDEIKKHSNITITIKEHTNSRIIYICNKRKKNNIEREGEGYFLRRAAPRHP